MVTMLKIGELATRSGLSRDTLRFYERQAVLPKPARTQAGYRLYGPEVVERLHFIKRAQALGFSLTEIKNLLDGFQDPEECAQVKRFLEQKLAELDRKMREMQALRDLMSRYLAECQQALENDRAAEPCPVLLDLIREPAKETPLQGKP